MDKNISGIGNEHTDEKLCRLVQQGDTEYFGIIVKRYESKMKRYATRFLLNKEESEDIVQDIFIKAYQNIQSFQTSKKFSSWLYRIAHNELINTIRKRQRKSWLSLDLDALFPHPVSTENPSRDTEQEITKEMTNRCLSKLSAKYREVLILYYLQDLSYREIADILHVPISTVGIRIKRGKDALRNICNKQGISYE